MFDETPQVKWYWKTYTLIVAVLSVGPLALPLLWFNPRFSLKNKWIWTGIVLVVSYVAIKIAATTLKPLLQTYQDLMKELN